MAAREWWCTACCASDFGGHRDAAVVVGLAPWKVAGLWVSRQGAEECSGGGLASELGAPAEAAAVVRKKMVSNVVGLLLLDLL